jgi:hypothetical protein
MKNHTENGQKRTDPVHNHDGIQAPRSVLAAGAQRPTGTPSMMGRGSVEPVLPPLHAPSSPSAPATPPSLWDRQPDEPAEAYQLFIAWLTLPSVRKTAAAAKKFGCSVHRVRRTAARHRWKTRTRAFDNYRASLASDALHRLLHREARTMEERADQFRQQEWALHEGMMLMAQGIIENLRKYPRSTSINDVVKLIDFASRLGRRAAGMPIDHTEPPPAPPALDLEWEAAIRKAYGPCAAPPARQPPAAPGQAQGAT